MAELYQQPKSYVTSGDPRAMPMQNGQPSVDDMIAQLPPEEREEALQYIQAEPTGEEIERYVKEKNANGEVADLDIAQYRLYKAQMKSKETDVISMIGEAGSKVFEDISAAAGAAIDDPANNLLKLTPSLVEAFSQGTRNLYGMAAQSADPSSIGFRVKNALLANGDDEEAELSQFMDAQRFTVNSINLASGKETLVMDKDLINHEATQLMAYVADPTLFIPFGGIGVKAASVVGMGERLAMASARASVIKRGLMAGTLKWGVGAPIEFMGTAVRNTIDFGLEKSANAFETVSGISAAEAKSVARMSGWGTAAASAIGAEVNPVLSGASNALVGSRAAIATGEAISAIGEQMFKQQDLGRGILSYAGQALKDSEKGGIILSKEAKGLLKIIDAVDPLFAYADEITAGAAQGSLIGAGLGYYTAGEEGMAGGIGSGMALGAIGAGAGRAFSDISGQTLFDRTAIQRKMVIEGLKQHDHVNAVAFEAMVQMAEATGDRRYQAQIDGIIAGIDRVAPNTIFKAFNEAQYVQHLRSQGIDPETGVLRERSRIFPEIGDRTKIADVLGILRDTGKQFAGDPKSFEAAVTTESRFQKLKPIWMRLDDNSKAVLLRQIQNNANPEFIKSLKGRELKDHYSDIGYAERLAESINTLNQKNSTQVAGKIAEYLKAETRSDKKLTRRGQMLKEKLQADGYIDKDGKIRSKRLKDVEGTIREFQGSAGWSIRRDSNGTSEVVINLDKWARDSGDRQSLPHELYHAIMLESVFMPDHSDRLIQKLIGKFDKDGKMIEAPSVNTEQVRKFMYGYIDAVHGNKPEEFINRKKRELDKSIEEYQSRGSQNRVVDSTQTPLEHLVEEFGAYYFSRWLMDKPVDFLFRGGELGGIRGLLESANDSWLDYWKGKIGSKNPSFNFDAVMTDLTKGFETPQGKRVKNTALDLLMRDMVRMEANRNRGGAFDISNLSQEAQAEFIRNNGLRGQGFATGNRVKRPSARKYTAEEIRQGKEMFKILDSLSDAEHRGGMRRDGDGNWSGKPNNAQINALVGAGFISRPWFDRMVNAYSIIEGNGSNTIEFGYLGYSAHIGDGDQRVYGAAVPFKNRKAILLDVEFKVKADGTVYSNFHTLDLRVIEARGNEIWKDPQVRDLWNGDRTDMEADFYSYLSNASLPSGDDNRKPSAMLLDRGDGLGSQRRDALHQMLGFHKGSDLPYINRPIAEIPVGIRHSVTTFSNDGIVNMRVENKNRVNYSHNNAHLDLSRNFMPSNMDSERTPAGGRVIRHHTGYRILEGTDKRFRLVDPQGNDLGKFDQLKDAGQAAQKHFNDTFDNSVEGKDAPVPPTEIPPSRQAYVERKLDLANNKELVESVRNGIIETQNRLKSNKAVQDATREALLKLEKEGLSKDFIETYENIEFEYQGMSKSFKDHIKGIREAFGREYDAMYPMEIKSALYPRLAQIFQDYPNLTAQGLLKKLVVYGSQGSRMFQEATEIGLVDLLKSKIQKTTTPRFLPDGTRIDMAQGVTQPKLDMTEILDFAKSKEIKVTIEEGAREVNNMDTSKYTLGGDKSNYKQTAIRINPEYAHGIRGHYGKDTIVHFRTTERLDANGNRVLYIEEVQANNTDKKKTTGEYITPEQARVSKEFAKRVVANRYADELEKRELKVTKIENEIEGLSAYSVGKNPDFSNKTRVDKVKRQKEAFNLILRNYIDLYKQNNSEYIRNIETATGTPDAPYGSKSYSKDIRQHWLNTKQIVESGLFLSELEKYFLTSSDPAEIWKQLLEFHDKDQFLQSKKRQRDRGNLPSLDDTLQEKVYQTLSELEKGSAHILDSIADLGYFIRVNNQDGINDVIDRIGGKVPYIDESLGRSRYITHEETLGRETLIEGLKDLANKDKFVQKYADAKIELDKYHDFVISDINSIGSFSHINYGEGRIESIHSDRLREFVSLANTSIDKFNTQGKEPVFPLTSARDWSLTALKGIIRQAIRDGLDRITLTHPDDSPTVSHMAEDARRGLYGKLIPEVWGSWLKKYGIEIVQENKLADANIEFHKNALADISSKLAEANKKVLEKFQQVGNSENPDFISYISTVLANPVHEIKAGEIGQARGRALSEVRNAEFRTLIDEALVLKSAESSKYSAIQQIREDGLRSRPVTTEDINNNLRDSGGAAVSAEAIDRGFTFVLNDQIKRDFLDGKIQTHMMPSNQGVEPIPMERHRKAGTGNVLIKVVPKLINDEIQRTNPIQSLRDGKNEKMISGVTSTERIKQKMIRGFWKNPEEAIDAAVLKFSDEKYIKGQGMGKSLDIDNGRHRLKAAEELDLPYSVIEVPKNQVEMFKDMMYQEGTEPPSPRGHKMPSSEGGRTYTDKQIAGEFIGRWSSEVPDLKKGLKLYYGKIPSGMGQESLTLRDKKGDVVANIRFERFGEDVSIEKSDVTPKHQGKGYGYLVYSELLERLRSEGVKTVSGMVIDNAERPIKIRKRLIDVENRRIGQPAKTEILDARYDEEGSKEIDVESYLKKDAWYQPAAGWREWKSENTTIGSMIRNAVGYMIMVNKDKFKVYNPAKALIGVYDSEEQAKRRVQRDEPKQ